MAVCTLASYVDWTTYGLELALPQGFKIIAFQKEEKMYYVHAHRERLFKITD